MEGRLNVHFYKAEYRELKARLIAHWGDIKRLDHYAEVVCGPFGTEITFADYAESGIPLLRISNIAADGTLDLSDVFFITSEKSAKLDSTQVVPGDLIISQRGTLGLVAVVGDAFPIYNISANLIAIRSVRGIEPKFLQQFLTCAPGAKQLERVQSGQVQAKITTEDVASILVPRMEMQRQFVAEWQAAREARNEKLRRSDALLASLDAYLLDTLGIAFPQEDMHPFFAVRRSAVARRLDVFFHQPALRKAEEAVHNAGLLVRALGSQLAVAPVNGVDARAWSESGRRYIRVQNVKRFDLDSHDIQRVESVTQKAISLKEGDILLTRKGSFGIAAQVTAEFTDCLISSEIILLRVSPNAFCTPEFITAWLNSSLMQRIIDRNKAGGIMGHLTQDVVAQLPVVCPDRDVQQQIAAEVRRRRQGARRLRAEAEADWATAKRHFEEGLLLARTDR